METHSTETTETLGGVYEAIRQNPASGAIEAVVQTLL